jgi:hypothetical protein
MMERVLLWLARWAVGRLVSRAERSIDRPFDREASIGIDRLRVGYEMLESKP